MIDEYYSNLVNGLEVRSSLLSIKEALKTPGRGSREKDALLLILDGDYSVFTGLLKNEDPKVRKNAAIILGLLGVKENVDAVYEAYVADDTMYSKAAYIEAIRSLDVEKYKTELKARFMELRRMTIDENFKKHVVDEMKQLLKIFGTGKLEFIGLGNINEVILTTNRNFKNVTEEALKKKNIKCVEMPAGLRLRTDRLTDVIHIRTFDEMFFVPDGIKTVSTNPKTAATQLVDAGIRDYIFSRIGIKREASHKNAGYRVNFRVEMKSKDRQKASDFAKEFSKELEVLTKWELSNSVSDYNLELRFIENKNDSLNVLIRFTVLKDERFSYRKEVIASTLKPYLAATLMNLAKPYLLGNSTVLDPFCGVGTLIVEREMAVNAKRYYGIDIFGEAISKAETNLKSAGILKKTELINRDFADFEHSYRFDEIVTDMPFETEKKSYEDIEKLYRILFEKADMLLEKKAVMVIYSRNPELVNKYYSLSNCIIKEDFEISKMEKSHLIILTR